MARLCSQLLALLLTFVTEHAVAIFGNNVQPSSCNLSHAANSYHFWSLIRAKKCWQRWPKKLGVEFESGLGLGMHIIKGKYHIKCVSQC